MIANKKISFAHKLQVIACIAGAVQKKYKRIKELCEQEASKGEWSFNYGGDIPSQILRRLRDDGLTVTPIDGGYEVSWRK